MPSLSKILPLYPALIIARLIQCVWTTTLRGTVDQEIKLRIFKLANVSILGKEKETGVGKLGWHGNFDTGFETYLSLSWLGW